MQPRTGVSRELSFGGRSHDDATVGSPGTPLYTAPEVWGSQYRGTLADIWSLGVTLHAMAFGCLPYTAADQMELIASVRHRPSQLQLLRPMSRAPRAHNTRVPHTGR